MIFILSSRLLPQGVAQLSPYNSTVLGVGEGAVQRAIGHFKGNLALTWRAMEDRRMCRS